MDAFSQLPINDYHLFIGTPAIPGILTFIPKAQEWAWKEPVCPAEPTNTTDEACQIIENLSSPPLSRKSPNPTEKPFNQTEDLVLNSFDPQIPFLYIQSTPKSVLINRSASAMGS
jgi:hypothetical protein